MVYLVCSAKSGSDWTDYDLEAFNIVIQDVDAATFFGLPHSSELSPTTVSPVVLNDTVLPRHSHAIQINKVDRLFFEYLQRADLSRKSAVNDFTNHVLRLLSFEDDKQVIATGKEMVLTMCGIRVSAKADIDVFRGLEHTLLIQEEKFPDLAEVDEPRVQLIATALAAFVENNLLRIPPSSQETFPAIAMVGTCAVFYKIPVTQALVNAMTTGQYPAEPTVGQRLRPNLPNWNSYRQYGMVPVENRRAVFQCLEALRDMIM